MALSGVLALLLILRDEVGVTGTHWRAVLGCSTLQLPSMVGGPRDLVGLHTLRLSWMLDMAGKDQGDCRGSRSPGDPGGPETLTLGCLPFCMEAWPNVAFSQCREFLLSFGLVERLLLQRGQGWSSSLGRIGGW